jgi:hypothetical protein
VSLLSMLSLSKQSILLLFLFPLQKSVWLRLHHWISHPLILISPPSSPTSSSSSLDFLEDLFQRRETLWDDFEREIHTHSSQCLIPFTSFSLRLHLKWSDRHLSPRYSTGHLSITTSSLHPCHQESSKQSIVNLIVIMMLSCIKYLVIVYNFAFWVRKKRSFTFHFCCWCTDVWPLHLKFTIDHNMSRLQSIVYDISNSLLESLSWQLRYFCMWTAWLMSDSETLLSITWPSSSCSWPLELW